MTTGVEIKTGKAQIMATMSSGVTIRIKLSMGQISRRFAAVEPPHQDAVTAATEPRHQNGDEVLMELARYVMPVVYITRS